MIQLVVIGMLLFAVVWFTHAGFTAASLVGQRWLPALAFSAIVGAPFGLGLLIYGVILREDLFYSGDSGVPWIIAGSAMEFSRYALLALMLYLIARRLPAGSRNAEGDESVD